MNWLLMAKLLDLESNRLFVISVVHMPCLFFNNDAMLLFADVALTRLDQFAGEDIPAIMMGDFNTLPNSIIYNYITFKEKREYMPNGWEPLLKSEWGSAYFLNHFKEPEYTTLTHIPSKHGPDPFKGAIDYVFIRNNILPSKIIMETVPDENLKDKLCPIPECPSDHLPMYGELIWD